MVSRAVQCSAVQCSAVQCSAVQCRRCAACADAQQAPGAAVPSPPPPPPAPSHPSTPIKASTHVHPPDAVICVGLEPLHGPHPGLVGQGVGVGDPAPPQLRHDQVDAVLHLLLVGVACTRRGRQGKRSNRECKGWQWVSCGVLVSAASRPRPAGWVAAQPATPLPTTFSKHRHLAQQALVAPPRHRHRRTHPLRCRTPARRAPRRRSPPPPGLGRPPR